MPARLNLTLPRVRPAKKSEARLREKVRVMLNRSTRNRPIHEKIEEVNRLLGGWQNYFWFGHPRREGTPKAVRGKTAHTVC